MSQYTRPYEEVAKSTRYSHRPAGGNARKSGVFRSYLRQIKPVLPALIGRVLLLQPTAVFHFHLFLLACFWSRSKRCRPERTQMFLYIDEVFGSAHLPQVAIQNFLMFT